jgi:hypothetical protein
VNKIAKRPCLSAFQHRGGLGQKKRTDFPPSIFITDTIRKVYHRVHRGKNAIGIKTRSGVSNRGTAGMAKTPKNLHNDYRPETGDIQYSHPILLG